jgi:mRNA interferase MazF
MVIRQGAVYWVDVGDPLGSAPGYRRPYVVIQNDAVNQTVIRTIIMCGLTTNLRRATAIGNVLLEDGEGGLPERSVVNVSQVFTVDKEFLVERIGQLSRARVREILDGVRLLTEPRELD